MYVLDQAEWALARGQIDDTLRFLLDAGTESEGDPDVLARHAWLTAVISLHRGDRAAYGLQVEASHNVADKFRFELLARVAELAEVERDGLPALLRCLARDAGEAVAATGDSFESWQRVARSRARFPTLVATVPPERNPIRQLEQAFHLNSIECVCVYLLLGLALVPELTVGRRPGPLTLGDLLVLLEPDVDHRPIALTCLLPGSRLESCGVITVQPPQGAAVANAWDYHVALDVDVLTFLVGAPRRTVQGGQVRIHPRPQRHLPLDAAARGLAGLWANRPYPPVLLVGPAGSGKSLAVRSAAGRVERLVVEVDLANGEPAVAAALREARLLGGAVLLRAAADDAGAVRALRARLDSGIVPVVIAAVDLPSELAAALPGAPQIHMLMMASAQLEACWQDAIGAAGIAAPPLPSSLSLTLGQVWLAAEILRRRVGSRQATQDELLEALGAVGAGEIPLTTF